MRAGPCRGRSPARPTARAATSRCAWSRGGEIFLVLIRKRRERRVDQLVDVAPQLREWASGQFLLALVAFVAAPITFFVYPWISGLGVLQLVWVVSMVAFIGGNALAGGAGRG